MYLYDHEWMNECTKVKRTLDVKFKKVGTTRVDVGGRACNRWYYLRNLKVRIKKKLVKNVLDHFVPKMVKILFAEISVRFLYGVFKGAHTRVYDNRRVRIERALLCSMQISSLFNSNSRISRFKRPTPFSYELVIEPMWSFTHFTVRKGSCPVSYTHLTLPTIYSV